MAAKDTQQEVIEVSPEMVEVTTEISIQDRVKPILEQAIDYVEGKSHYLMKTYAFKGEIKTKKDLTLFKSSRAGLRREIQEMEARRKELKEPFAWAVKTIDTEFAKALEAVKEQDAKYKTEIDRYTEQVKQNRHDALVAYYNEQYPALAEFVDFEQLDALHQKGEKSWYAANCTDVKAQDMLDADANEIAEAIMTIDSMHFENEDDRLQLKSDYYQTLKLTEAVAKSNERIQARKLEEARRAQIKAHEEALFQQRLAEQKAREEEAARIAAEQAAQPEPEVVYEMAPEQPVEVVDPATIETTYQLTITITQAQKQALIEFFKANDIHGSLKVVR